ncbi:MAG: PASTA domain-containing protein [Jatrophihabitans sp.]|uniref:PASTA domain-containing protein n=1 Tax=Jatrophihabitans sp. TaxID=1932789 RepID=UPI00390FAC66
MSKLWKRLGPWLPGGEAPDDGDAALRALAGVADVRRSLDQAELLAVRTARRHGKSWTEIATMLTISRQSAWERWRELDCDAETPPDERARIGASAAIELAGRIRRRRTVAVPDLVGLTSADALGILTHAGLEAVSATPGIELRDSGDDVRPTVVVRQSPDPGTRIQAASAVKLWLERGDGEAGVRERRRPTTPPRAARAERDERAEEAVG